MSVKTLRTIAVALIFPLFDLCVMGVDVLPDIIGLVILLPCFILMTEHAGKFSAPALISAAMIFLEAARMAGLVPAGPVAVATEAPYLFLFSLMMITWGDGMRELCTYCKTPSLARLAGCAGYAAAAVAPMSMLGMVLPGLAGLLWLASLLLSGFAFVAALFFFSRLTLPTAGESEAAEPETGVEGRYVTLSEPVSLEGNITATSVFLDEA